MNRQLKTGAFALLNAARRVLRNPTRLLLYFVVFLSLLNNSLAGEGHEQTTWPFLNGDESVADYAKRVDLPPTKDVQLDSNLKLEAVLIPSGKFKMGSPETEKGRNEDETQHDVTISRPFYMGKFLVTQEQYKAVMGSNPSYSEAKLNPVETVSWDNAQEFCNKASEKSGITVRLATEAEWEFACRAGTTTAYNTGDTITTSDANFGVPPQHHRTASQVKSPTPVGSFPPNRWGLYDMHGNVWEWCWDWYDPKYYSKSPAADPKGGVQGDSHAKVMRGGACEPWELQLRSAQRSALGSSDKSASVGFRVVVDVVVPKHSVNGDEKKVTDPTVHREKADDTK